MPDRDDLIRKLDELDDEKLLSIVNEVLAPRQKKTTAGSVQRGRDLYDAHHRGVRLDDQ